MYNAINCYSQVPTPNPTPNLIFVYVEHGIITGVRTPSVSPFIANITIRKFEKIYFIGDTLSIISPYFIYLQNAADTLDCQILNEKLDLTGKLERGKHVCQRELSPAV